MSLAKLQLFANELHNKGFYSYGPPAIDHSDFIIGCSLEFYETTQRIPYLREVKSLDGDFYLDREQTPQLIFYEKNTTFFVKVEAYTLEGEPVVLWDASLTKEEMMEILQSVQTAGIKLYDVEGPRWT